MRTVYNPVSGSFDLIEDKANKIKYTQGTPADWTTNPQQVAEALDELAARPSGGASVDVETRNTDFTAVNGKTYLTTGAISVQLPAPAPNVYITIKKTDDQVVAIESETLFIRTFTTGQQSWEDQFNSSFETGHLLMSNDDDDLATYDVALGVDSFTLVQGDTYRVEIDYYDLFSPLEIDVETASPTNFSNFETLVDESGTVILTITITNAASTFYIVTNPNADGAANTIKISEYRIYKTSSVGLPVGISGYIEGGNLTYQLTSIRESATLVSDGTDWFRI
jgi:hypothetical protein